MAFVCFGGISAWLTVIVGLVKLDAASAPGFVAHDWQTIMQHHQPFMHQRKFDCQCSLLGAAGCSKGTGVQSKCL